MVAVQPLDIDTSILGSRPSAWAIGSTSPAAVSPDQGEVNGEAAAPRASTRDYHPELSTSALIAEVRRLLVAERRARRLICRYLADLADRIRDRRDDELLPYVDELQAAECFFDLGARETRERVRIGRALRNLPQLEAAFVAGELSYSRVREVTRVANAETEATWLALARDLDMRALEQRVASSTVQLPAGALPQRESAERPLPAPSAARSSAGAPPPLTTMDNQATTNDRPTTPRAPDPVGIGPHRPVRPAKRVTFELSAEAWALLERALDGARQRAAAPLSDAEAIESIARDALAMQHAGTDHASEAPGERSPDFDAHMPPQLEQLEASPNAPSQSATEASLGAVPTALGPTPEDVPSSEPTESTGPPRGETATQLGTSNDLAADLLRLIEPRGRWTLDELVYESGQSVPVLQHALLMLELDGRIRCSSGWVDPV